MGTTRRVPTSFSGKKRSDPEKKWCRELVPLWWGEVVGQSVENEVQFEKNLREMMASTSKEKNGETNRNGNTSPFREEEIGLSAFENLKRILEIWTDAGGTKKAARARELRPDELCPLGDQRSLPFLFLFVRCNIIGLRQEPFEDHVKKRKKDKISKRSREWSFLPGHQITKSRFSTRFSLGKKDFLKRSNIEIIRSFYIWAGRYLPRVISLRMPRSLTDQLRPTFRTNTPLRRISLLLLLPLFSFAAPSLFCIGVICNE